MRTSTAAATYDDNQRVGDRAAFDYAERGAGQWHLGAGGLRVSRLLSSSGSTSTTAPSRVAPTRFSAGGYDAEIAFADEALDGARATDQRAGGHLVVAWPAITERAWVPRARTSTATRSTAA